MSEKRILRDLHILDNNKVELNSRHVYYNYNPDNIRILKVLIIPNVYPYEDGLFLFEFTFPDDYPHIPPQVIFYPKQNYARMHPNFYENGKVCLSVINTWGDEDWTPSMSILSIITILESRFDSRSLCYEPCREKSLQVEIDNNNKIIEYAKYLSICDILELCNREKNIYNSFYDIIINYHKNTIEKIKNFISPLKILYQVCYSHHVYIDYRIIKQRLENIYINP